ncbi:hypothetical protein FHR24_001674 [Wenyingzhuangia heitensis]|uniref:Uncharacterized protein n=1 Tax=Wenyingzhuangia heitensis TaxID=1487859 RepID=A0ABX0UBM7_9FLAO|nr:hypothetical protein [Wenyingzhuangia heitensis]NIJ45235.1 hypothetical protein [Wenyingzhuangia heitensis]
MKKFLKISALVLVVLFTSLFMIGIINNESLPKGEKGDRAELLATRMLTALNKNAYDNITLLEWSFIGGHDYKWYKKEDKVEVAWADNKVILFTKQPKKSKVYVDGKEVNAPELIKKAIKYFNNDSFWLVAPYKVKDSGAERSIVKHNGKNSLLVTYTSGGSTPGDSYLWILDDNFIPISFKMWVTIIPIGGLKTTWEDWITTKAGCKLPTNHTLKLIGMDIHMGDVKASN